MIIDYTCVVGVLALVSHGPWTLKTATAMNQANTTVTPTSTTRQGFVHGPASLTSSTALASGVVRLVTASQITASGLGEVGAGVFATLTLHFIPEPGLLLLLASGGGGLLLLGRRRIRR